MPPTGARARIAFLRRRIAAIEARDGQLPHGMGAAGALDHAAFERNRSNAEKVIDSRKFKARFERKTGFHFFTARSSSFGAGIFRGAARRFRARGLERDRSGPSP